MGSPRAYKAIDYSLSHWEGLSRFMLDGAVPIDNNHIENQMRPWALGPGAQELVVHRQPVGR